ncbi:MAG: hypothetical protein ACI4JM_07130 [Oscillospiraceae bacterium]
MSDNIKDEKIYLLCDDTEEYYALMHKEEVEEMRKKTEALSKKHIKEIKEQYNL